MAGYSVIRRLMKATASAGASEAELAAITRLGAGTAELVDLERLEPLADLAALPWRELFPQLPAK